MALAITPRDEFGDSRVVRGFKPRDETELWLGPVRTAGEILPSSVDGIIIRNITEKVGYYGKNSDSSYE